MTFLGHTDNIQVVVQILWKYCVWLFVTAFYGAMPLSFACNSEGTEGAHTEGIERMNMLQNTRREEDYLMNAFSVTKKSHIEQFLNTQIKLWVSFCIVFKVFFSSIVYNDVIVVCNQMQLFWLIQYNKNIFSFWMKVCLLIKVNKTMKFAIIHLMCSVRVILIVYINN